MDIGRPALAVTSIATRHPRRRWMPRNVHEVLPIFIHFPIVVQMDLRGMCERVCRRSHPTRRRALDLVEEFIIAVILVALAPCVHPPYGLVRNRTIFRSGFITPRNHLKLGRTGKVVNLSYSILSMGVVVVGCWMVDVGCWMLEQQRRTATSGNMIGTEGCPLRGPFSEEKGLFD